MKKGKTSLRQSQADKTKKKINKAAAYFFNKYGFENTKIEEICIKAGVSVGTLYHYYPSKSDIYCELYKEIDEHYEKDIRNQLNEDGFYDNIIVYFKHYADFNNTRGIEAVRQSFNRKNQIVTDKSGVMGRMLTGIIESAKEKKQLAEGRDVNETEALLTVMADGVIYDWAMNGGEYDLADRMVKYISELRPVIQK